MKPFRSTTFFSNGLSSRPPVTGTVPRGFLRADKAFYTGKKDTATATPGTLPALRHPRATSNLSGRHRGIPLPILKRPSPAVVNDMRFSARPVTVPPATETA